MAGISVREWYSVGMREVPGSDTRTKVEKLPEKTGIFRRSDKYFASADGVHSVEVEKTLAENIAIALRVQEKVDEALMIGHRPGFLKTVAMLNCRKSVRAISGTSLRELLQKKPLPENHSSLEKRKYIDELSGVPEMMLDIERLLVSGRVPVLGTNLDMHIAEHLDNHAKDIPAVVHLLNIPEKRVSEIIRKLLGKSQLTVEDAAKLHRNHSFVVLGKAGDGSYICFQKQGPLPTEKFELRRLDAVLFSALESSNDVMHLSFIGPLSREDEDSTAKQQAA